MAKIAVDLRSVDMAGEFPVYPEGLYTLEVSKAEQGTSKNNNPKLTVSFKIIDGPDGSEEFEGKPTVRSFALHNETSLGFLKQFVASCGLDPDDPDSLDDELLVGAKVKAYLRQGEYQGRVNNEVIIRGAAEEAASAPAPEGMQQV